jgi:hypothetical protein
VTSALTLPKRPSGRPSAEASDRYRDDLSAWCAGIEELASTLDFKVSSRGWCYILEQHSLSKGDFDTAQRLINDCRKSGDLPLDICAEDDRRTAEHLEELDENDPADEARRIVNYVRDAHSYYQSVSFWQGRDIYIEVMVEKIDLKSLFAGVCEPFRIPLTNAAG